MIYLMCFLTFLGLSGCQELVPTRFEIEISINRTIQEVERLIDEDKSLPRLSRSQIVDILHNITSKDMDSYEVSVEKARSEYQRALTVVLPYNSKNSQGDDLKDLFTKPPLVQIIPDSGTMLPFSSIQEEPVPTSAEDNIIGQSNSGEERLEYKNHRNTYSDVHVEKAPERFSFNLENLRTTTPEPVTSKSNLEIIYSTSVTDKSKTTTPEMEETTFRQKNDDFRPTMPTKMSTSNLLSSDQWTYYAPPLAITSTTTRRPKTTTTSTTTRRPKTTTASTTTQRPKTTTASTTTQRPKTTTASTTTQRPKTTTSTTTQRPTSTTTQFITTLQPILSKTRGKPNSFLPTVVTKVTDDNHPPKRMLETTSKKPQTITFVSNNHMSKKLIEKSTKKPQVVNFGTYNHLPEELIEITSKKPQTVTFDTYNNEMLMNHPTVAMYVTPMATSTSSKTPSSTTSETSKILSPPKKEVASLLAAIGLRPTIDMENAEPHSNAPPQEMIFGTDFTIPESNNIFPSHTAALSAGVDSPTIVGQNSFSYFPSNLQTGMNNLTPDVQLLFQRFGLPASGKVNELSTSTTVKSPTARPTSQKDSWSKFKPLPTTAVKDEGMKEFLAKFGLGGVENRNQKAMKNEKSPVNDVPSIIEAVPNNMKNILENIGLITRSTAPRKVKLPTTTEASAKLHVFKPHESLFNDEMQRSKINELLDTVKLVQEGKADVTDVRKAANELLKNTKTLSGGPDPMSLDEILKIYNEDVKNEVKRQESENKLNLADMATGETTLDSVMVPPNATANSNSSVITKNSEDSSSDASGTSAVAMDSDNSSSDSTGKSATTSQPALPTQGPNIDDLVDSFGGSTAEPDPVLPTPRKSGLYFLVDWNSFLEVGEEDKDKVNLRFAPKVGDRTRFIPVVVP